MNGSPRVRRQAAAAEAVNKRLAAERRAGEARLRWRETERRAMILANRLERSTTRTGSGADRPLDWRAFDQQRAYPALGRSLAGR